MNEPPLRVLIVDDEPAARRGLRLQLESLPGCECVGECADADTAVAAVRAQRPDLLLLDVQMPGRDGFSVLAELSPEERPGVIFVTAHDEFALRAFEVNAVDYLLKPCSDERFAAALARARQERRNGGPVDDRLRALLDQLGRGGAGRSPAGERIVFRSGGEIYFLRAEEIDWIEAEGDYVKFHAAGKHHLLRETMTALERRLDPARFVRIHRSTIVNLDRVKKLTPAFAGEYLVVLGDGTKLKLSRGYQERLQQLLDPRG